MTIKVGSVLEGLYQDSPRVINSTPPTEAPDGAIRPEYAIEGEVAGKPSSFVAHGVGLDELGAYPNAASATLIPNGDTMGAPIVNPARAGDGYGLRGAGTPEPAINAPKRGAILDSRGIVHLGIGPGVPLVLLLIIAGYLLLTRQKGRIIE